MGEAILYNKSVVADKQYNWNKAFNNEDFISYVINATPIDYVGLEEFIPAYEYMDKRNFVTVSFPNCWMNIGSHAFDGCTKISYANFSSQKFESYSVYIIDEYAFRNCNRLESIDLGIARHIKSHAFENLHNLLEFRNNQAPYPYQLLNIEDYAFANCEKLSVFNGYGYQYINSIGDYAFYNCGFSTLSSIGSSVCSKIGSHAFENCKSLSYVNNLNFSGMNSSILTDVGDYAFAGCSKLLTCNIYLQTIGSHAFDGCISLNTFSMGNIVPWCKKIGEYAFNRCSRLYSLNINPARSFNCQVDDYAFTNCGDLYNVQIYEISSLGKNLFDNTSIFTLALFGMNNNSDLYIPSNTFSNILNVSYLSLFSFFSISSYAFQSLKLLSVLAIDTIYIGSHAFENCASLSYFQANTSYSIGVYCGEYAFAGCTNLSTLTVGLNYVGSHAFESCINLIYVQGPPFINYIGAYAFHGCSQLNSDLYIIDSPSLEYIGSHAFDGCSTLRNIYLTSVLSVPTLESIDAFDNMTYYTFYVTSDMYNNYINDSVWGLLSDHISVSSY